MKYVYAEEIFFVNYAANFLISYTLCRVKAYNRKIIRCVFSALIGTVYAFFYLFEADFFYSICMKLIFTLFMSFALCFKPTLKKLFTDFFLLVFLACLCAGLTLLFSLLFSMNNPNFAFSDVNYYHMILGVLTGCICGYKLIKCIFGAIAFDKIIYDCELSYNNKTIKTKMLADSGNLITTFSGEPVCIVKNELFFYLTGIQAKTFLNSEDYIDFIQNLNYKLQSRISFAGAQGVTGRIVMMIFRIDKIIIADKCFDKAFIASSENIAGSIDGIFNPAMLGGNKL